VKIRLRVKEVCFGSTGPYVAFDEPYQDTPDSLDCNVKVLIPETETQEWIGLIGKEVLFERVRPLSRTGNTSLPDPSGS
jgi:hypothetical protein